MNNRRSLNNVALSLIVLAFAYSLGTPQPAAGARRNCDTENYSGNRMKCKAENLNDALDTVLSTAINDDSKAFSEKQKNQLRNMKERSKRETARMKPEDFKQMGKKRTVSCYTQEILGDDIGDEDGICEGTEPCAEVLNDGIGDENGICTDKGKYKETCVQICDPDLILAEGNESNVEPDKEREVEQSLSDATAVLDQTNTTLVRFVAARSMAVTTFGSCDKETMTSCQYLQCLVNQGRGSSADTIKALVISAASLQLVANVWRDASDQTVPIFPAGSFDFRALALPLGLAANGVMTIANMVEILDDSETAERLDAAALCAAESGGDAERISELVQKVQNLLLQPQGQRSGF